MHTHIPTHWQGDFTQVFNGHVLIFNNQSCPTQVILQKPFHLFLSMTSSRITDQHTKSKGNKRLANAKMTHMGFFMTLTIVWLSHETKWSKCISKVYIEENCVLWNMFLLFAWMVQQCYDSWFNDDNWKIQDLKWAKRQIKVVLNGSIKGAIQPPTALDQ